MQISIIIVKAKTIKTNVVSALFLGQKRMNSPEIIKKKHPRTRTTIPKNRSICLQTTRTFEKRKKNTHNICLGRKSIGISIPKKKKMFIFMFYEGGKESENVSSFPSRTANTLQAAVRIMQIFTCSRYSNPGSLPPPFRIFEAFAKHAYGV